MFAADDSARRTLGAMSGVQTRNLVTPDGMTLVARRVPATGPERGVAFVGHGQAQHSLLLVPFLQGMGARGWTAQAVDMRGHGQSTSSRAPLAHMEVGSGWERLVADMRHTLAATFDGIPWERRLVIAPGLAAALVLEVLKTWPDLAARIVIAAPPTLNRAILGLGRTFMAARVRLRPADAPDELALHQTYTFLAAQLPDPRALVDVISSDRRITDALIDDPLAFPVPTSGYFHEMFRGLAQAWTLDGAATVAPGTRLMLLYGDEDPVTANGRFLGPLLRRLGQIGIGDVDCHRLKGARSGLLLEEARFGLSALVADWAGGASPAAPPAPAAPDLNASRVTAGVLERLGVDDRRQPLAEDALVELCYHAIEDDSRWIELLYRLANALDGDAETADARLDGVISVLMPHWERSFSVSRQIAQAAAVGTVLQNVIDRLAIGVAIVDADLAVLFANPAFIAQIGTPDGLTPRHNDRNAAMTAALRALCDAPTRERLRKGAGETLLMRDAETIGFHFRPPALRQAMLHRGGASGVIILRNGTRDGQAARDQQADLLQFAYGLTRKEAETTLCLLDGLGAEVIGSRLGISVNTVRTHLKRVYDKLGVQSQTELVARLLRGPLGLLVGAGPGPGPGHGA